MKKTNKTKAKSLFTVDLTYVENVRDIYSEFGIAKQKAGLAMTKREFGNIIARVISYTSEIQYCMDIAFHFKDNNGLILEDGVFKPINIKSVEVRDDEMLVIKKGKGAVKKINIFKRFWNWITRKK